MESMETVWREYEKTRDPILKETIILKYAHLIKCVASKLCAHLGQHVEFEDMLSYGTFGLIDAINKFDMGKGVKFETYASLRIRGAIIDGIRKLDWVPRALRQKSKQLETACAELEGSLGREPTETELAARLAIREDEVSELVRKSSVVALVSLDDYLDQNHEMPFYSTSCAGCEMPEEQYELQEMKETLTEAIEKLSEKERQVITLYYFKKLTLKEISRIIGVSESRVSQIHSKAVLRLRTRLGRFRSLLLT